MSAVVMHHMIDWKFIDIGGRRNDKTVVMVRAEVGLLDIFPHKYGNIVCFFEKEYSWDYLGILPFFSGIKKNITGTLIFFVEYRNIYVFRVKSLDDFTNIE